LDVGAFYAEGLLAGTNPSHPEYWGQIGDCDQRLVECADIAWSLYLAKRHIWDCYTAAQKEQVARYLFQCTKARYYDCNWLLFGVVVNAVLKRLGMRHSQRQIDRHLACCERMYVGMGWYRDGEGNRFDYYNAWAFHYHGLQWVILDGDSNLALAELLRARMATFAADFRYFFARDGSTPCYGRSMLYRCAYLGPLVLGHLLGCLGIDTGELKTMVNLGGKFFFDQEILTDRLHLGMGYLKPCESMIDPYSCGGSPYWACRALNLLQTAPDDALWRAVEAPLPIHCGDFSVALDAPGFLLLGETRSGHVQLVNHKSYHRAEYNAKYTKFAYSSAFSYDTCRIHGSWNCDSILQFSGDGVIWHERQAMENLYCERGFAASRYVLVGVDDRGVATTYTLVKASFLLHFHHVVTEKDLFFREGGYPLGFDQGVARFQSSSCSEAAWKDGRLTYMRNLFGYTSQTKVLAYGGDGGGVNVRYAHSVVPVVCGRIRGQRGSYLASLVCGKVGDDSLEELDRQVTEFRVTANCAFVRFGDKEEAYLQMGPIMPVEIELGGARLQGAIVMARVAADGTRQVVTARAAAEAAPAEAVGGHRKRGRGWWRLWT
jgi:hypothetical protein